MAAGRDPEINQQLPLIATAILVLSAVIYNFAESKFESSKGAFTVLLLLAIILGAVFIGSTIYEYNHLLAEGFKPGTNTFSSPFYTLTGFHVAHILVGVLAFVVILFGTLFGKVHSSFVKLAGVYWYFVTFLSFFVVTQVYFW